MSDVIEGTTERTRVLLFANSRAIGGMEEHVRLLAQHLDRDRFEVVTVVPDDPGLASFTSALAEVSDVAATITPDRRFGVRHQVRESVRLLRFMRRARIRVAHLHSTTFAGLWIATIVCRITGVRRVYVTEHLAPYEPISIGQRWTRTVFGFLLTGVVCVSERNRAARATQIRTPPSSTVVVPNGIDVTRFDHVPSEAIERVRTQYDLTGKAVVGTAIRLERGKGVEDLVDAFALLAPDHPDARLLIVGEGKVRAALEDRVSALGIVARVVFTGFHVDPRPFVGAMDVFVLPVPAGSASIALLEAMAMGRPSVITFGGEGEAVVPGVHGWWAAPHDPASIAERVGALLDDDVARSQMGKAARERVEIDFSAEQVARRLGDLYVS